MITSRIRTCGLVVGVALIGAAFAGCDTFSSSASCEEFQAEYATFGNPKLTDMISKAYFEKHPDESSVSGMTMMNNLERVRVGCKQDPSADIDSFIE